MTATRRWLERWSARLQRRQVSAVAFLVLGLVLAAFGFGLLLGRIGVYLLVPPTVFLGWLVAAGAVVWGLLWMRRRLSRSRPSALARAVELECGLRHGSISGVTEQVAVSGSPELSALADERAAGWLDESGQSG